MKIIIKNNRIAGTATDAYAGPDEYIDAPADFDAERMGEYVYADGALTLEHVVPQQVARAQGKAPVVVAPTIIPPVVVAPAAVAPTPAAPK